MFILCSHLALFPFRYLMFFKVCSRASEEMTQINVGTKTCLLYILFVLNLTHSCPGSACKAENHLPQGSWSGDYWPENSAYTAPRRTWTLSKHLPQIDCYYRLSLMWPCSIFFCQNTSFDEKHVVSTIWDLQGEKKKNSLSGGSVCKLAAFAAAV